jgi:hypothetical protein
VDLRLLVAFETVDLLVTGAAFALLVREVLGRAGDAAYAARVRAAHHRTLRLTHAEPVRDTA